MKKNFVFCKKGFVEIYLYKNAIEARCEFQSDGGIVIIPKPIASQKAFMIKE